MPLTKKTWSLYLALGLLGFFIWLSFGYSDFSFVDLSVSKDKALRIAQDYLSSRGVHPETYRHVLILDTDTNTDRYLQKNLGFEGELAFLRHHHINIFHWIVRFFKEGEKEEYRVTVDSSQGRIVSYSHLIDDTAKREDVSLDKAYEEVKAFFVQRFAVDFKDYTARENVTKKRDNRTDYTFSWQKTEVSIPWSQEKDSGTAKLMIGARISGHDILSFDAGSLEIPEGFNRSIEKSKQSGHILTGLFLVLYYILIMASTYAVVIKRYHFVMQQSKKFYVALAVILFVLVIAYYLNNIPDILFDYPTTSTLSVYFSELSLGLLVSTAFLALIIILPGLAGESLASESPHKTQGFAPYIQTTFFSRQVASLIGLGYLVAVMMFGLQALLFYLGRTYGNVWVERLQISQVSSSFWPFLTTLGIAFRAGLSEEIFFRLFGVNWVEKMCKNIFAACLITSMIWGFGHTHYPVFPVWFRGLEVSLLGLMLCFFYLRHGIIPVIIAHYLFDAVWGAAGFLFGKAQPFDFTTCLLVVLLPFFFAIVAFLMNKPPVMKQAALVFRKYQLFNLNVLTHFFADPKNTAGKTQKDIREDFVKHGWDGVVVDEALKRATKNDVAN